MHAVMVWAVTGRALQRTEHGQGLAEYALILSLIALIAVLSLAFLGGTLSTMLGNVGSSV